jgi:hypothetical protein
MGSITETYSAQQPFADRKVLYEVPSTTGTSSSPTRSTKLPFIQQRYAKNSRHYPAAIPLVACFAMCM